MNSCTHSYAQDSRASCAGPGSLDWLIDVQADVHPELCASVSSGASTLLCTTHLPRCGPRAEEAKAALDAASAKLARAEQVSSVSRLAVARRACFAQDGWLAPRLIDYMQQGRAFIWHAFLANQGCGAVADLWQSRV